MSATLTLSCAATNRTRPILDGRVAIPGVTLLPLVGEPKDIFLRVVRDRAFARARALAELSLTNLLSVSLPWIAEAHRRQAALPGGDPWPYGFARNRPEIATMIRHAAEDGLIAAPVAPEALFHPSTLSEPVAA